MKIKKNTLISYILFLCCNLFYFYFFVYTHPIKSQGSLYFEYYSIFYLPLNYDYLKYIHLFGEVESGSWAYLSAQDYWIVYFYVHLQKLIPIDYDILSFFVNNVFFLLSYYYLIKILVFARLSTRYSWLFFFNPQLIYYSQIINKEPPTLFFVFCLTYLVLTKKKLLFVFITILATMIRQQLLIFSVFLLFIHTAKNYRWRLFHAYIISAIGAVIFAIKIISKNADAFATARFVKFVSDVNQKYYVGNLFFAPLKIIQWIYEQLLSLLFITPEGYINLYLLRDVTVIIMLTLLFKKIVSIFLNIKIYCVRGERILISAVFAFVFTLLMNPMVHQRYLFPIEVLLIALGLGKVALGRKKMGYNEND